MKGCFASMLPTVMGNHWWAVSWMVTPATPRGLSEPGLKTSMGYSIPPTGPSVMVTLGQG